MARVRGNLNIHLAASGGENGFDIAGVCLLGMTFTAERIYEEFYPLTSYTVVRVCMREEASDKRWCVEFGGLGEIICKNGRADDAAGDGVRVGYGKMC